MYEIDNRLKTTQSADLSGWTAVFTDGNERETRLPIHYITIERAIGDAICIMVNESKDTILATVFCVEAKGGYWTICRQDDGSLQVDMHKGVAIV